MISKAKPIRRNRILNGARDFLTGLGLFAIVFTVGSYLPNRSVSEPVPIFMAPANASSPHPYAARNRLDDSQFVSNLRSADERASVVVLAIVFASLVTLNLAFVRHLRRVYASPRQG